MIEFVNFIFRVILSILIIICSFSGDKCYKNRDIHGMIYNYFWALMYSVIWIVLKF